MESLLFAKRAAQDINAHYSPIDIPSAKTAEGALDLSKYSNPSKLLKQYKCIIRDAIDAENAKTAAAKEAQA